MKVTYLPSQIDSTSSTTALPYTTSPLGLVWYDVKLGFSLILAMPLIVWPLKPWDSGPLDELYPSKENLSDLFMHALLMIFQTIFLLSIPCCVALPLAVFLLYILAALVINATLCKILNGSKTYFESSVELEDVSRHADEKWIFLNGVAAGHNWLQSALDRLSLAFGRKIVGVHNPTTGIMFDVLQCLIQRDFSYCTQDVRDGYVILKEAINDPAFKKIVLVLHSQGGIEGGLMLDWLFDDVSAEVLQKVEVYTFGNAASHFNNPIRSYNTCRTNLLARAQKSETAGKVSEERVIRHIEHYANSEEFVSRWGILNFTRSNVQNDNRFVGRLFVRKGSGHLFNQHYLDNMFSVDPDTKRVKDSNAFMDTLVDVDDDLAIRRESASMETISNRYERGPAPSKPSNGHLNGPANGTTAYDTVNGVDETERTPLQSIVDGAESVLSPGACLAATKEISSRARQKPVKELSRLWLYRNGMSPSD
ncbi:MAG: hypothetical protein M1837_001919 [Sclerophora amabilis]|nr:MAG: hypothetical protein M1837_001919 [Sclerophora amabilis]